MRLAELKVLYVCNDFPFPPRHGGLLDMWNRIQSLHRLGVTVDVIATAAVEPTAIDRKEVERFVRKLTIVKRQPLRSSLFSLSPGQVAIRRDIRFVELNESYNLLLMQSEFTTEILHNETIRYATSAIRVDNDEVAYYKKAARAEKSLIRKLYYLQEGFRLRFHCPEILPKVNMLWFVSHDELSRYKEKQPAVRQSVEFVPAGIDVSSQLNPSLQGSQVIFVGNLWNPLNRIAIEWYLRDVHPLLSEYDKYHLAVAGSTNGKACDWLQKFIDGEGNVRAHLDEPDLTQLYLSSAVFINPMREGAGVKLKTIEAALRGLPIVSTGVGAEGSGFVAGVHYKRADTAEEFACCVREFLADRILARTFASRAQKFVIDNYDQTATLKRILSNLPQ